MSNIFPYSNRHNYCNDTSGVFRDEMVSSCSSLNSVFQNQKPLNNSNQSNQQNALTATRPYLLNCSNKIQGNPLKPLSSFDVPSSSQTEQLSQTSTFEATIRSKTSSSLNPYCANRKVRTLHHPIKSEGKNEHGKYLPKVPVVHRQNQPKTALQLLLSNREYETRQQSLQLLGYRVEKRLYHNNNQRNTNNGSSHAMSSSTWLEVSSNGGIYELVGEAGSGKTQVALNLCVQTAAQETYAQCMNPSGNEIRSIYISLKGSSFVSRVVHRMNQMAASYTVESNVDAEEHTLSNASTIMKRILTRACTNTDDLFHLLQNDLPSILKAGSVNGRSERQRQEIGTKMNQVRLLVIDSVADLFRGQLDTGNTRNDCRAVDNESAKRAYMLFKFSSILKRLSDVFNPLTIVVVNQVTAKVEGSLPSIYNETNGTGSKSSNLLLLQVPALGLSWAHCVNTSFLLFKQNGFHCVSLRKSSKYQTGSVVNFAIETEGCFLV